MTQPYRIKANTPDPLDRTGFRCTAETQLEGHAQPTKCHRHNAHVKEGDPEHRAFDNLTERNPQGDWWGWTD